MDAELRDLRLFQVLAEEEHFSRAAAVAGVTQPTLTRSLARLERTVGVRLVDRTTRSVALTDEGRRLAADLASLLPQLDTALRNVSAHPSLRLGFTWLLPSDLVRRAAAALRESTGGEVTLVRRDDRSGGVARGATDLAVVYGRVPSGESLRLVGLGTEDRVAAVGRDHPLARRRRLHWAELAEQALVVNEASGTVGPSLWPASARPSVAVRCRTYDEWIEMVAAGRGVGVLPASARDRPTPGSATSPWPTRPRSSWCWSGRRGPPIRSPTGSSRRCGWPRVARLGGMTDSATAGRATALLDLHRAEKLLTVVNVWDVISAKVVSDVPGTTALATASHSIAASYGYPDGENIPRDLMIEAVGRIAGSTSLPVSADLEGGYGDAAETVRRAIGVGIVGANIEDQLKPLPEAARQVEAIMKAAEAEGVPDFVLNARTDAFHLGRDRDPAENLAEAVERGKAYLDAGAPVVFVPARLDRGAGRHPGRGVRPAAADRDRDPRHPAAGPPGGARRRPRLLRPAVAERRAHRPAGAGRGRPEGRGRALEHAGPQLS